MRLRPFRDGDLPFLREMVYEAAYWHPSTFRLPIEEALVHPAFAPYVEGWGRAGDAAVIAEEGGPAGAAWYRLFTSDAPGYGFVDERTPELGIAVVAGRRGGGIGEGLLAGLCDTARAAGHAALSLSHDLRNPARRLYERAGFVEVRRAGGSAVMLRRLR